MSKSENQNNGGREWNDGIHAAHGSFLQSSEWGELQAALGRPMLRVSEGGCAGLVLKRSLPLGFCYLHAPRGPVGDVNSDASLAAWTKAAIRESSEWKPLFLRIEPPPKTPEDVLVRTGFTRAPDAQPHETRVMDLEKTEEELLRDMEHDTRYAIRTAEKRGVVVRVIADVSLRRAAFPQFWGLFKETSRRHGLADYSEEYYRRVAELSGECPATLFLAEHEGRPVGGAIMVAFRDTAVYLYAASAGGMGKLNAPSATLWALMQHAKAQGIRTLDLWGVSESKPEWRGVSDFKKSFGGALLTYPGTWDLPLRPFWHRLYSVAKSLRS